MRKEVVLEVRPGRGPEAHVQPGDVALLPALDGLHHPLGAVVASPLGLHEHLHVPHHVSVSLMDAGSHQLKLFQGKL